MRDDEMYIKRNLEARVSINGASYIFGQTNNPDCSEVFDLYPVDRLSDLV